MHTDSEVEHDLDLSIVIVSFNALEWLERCLRSTQQASSNGRRIEVIVVDNASGEDVRSYLRQRPYGVTAYLLDDNVGFARGCNLGVSKSSGRFVLLLNPDAELHPGAVDPMLDTLEDQPWRGVIGGRTVLPSGTPGPGSCWGEPSLWSWFCAAVGLTALFRSSRLFDPESLHHERFRGVTEVDIVSGCLLMTARSTWDAMDGLDEDYFMYGEDADFSLRAREDGYRPSIVPAAVAVHALSQSTTNRAEKQVMLLRGKMTYARKRWTRRRARVGVGITRSGVALRATAETLTRRQARPFAAVWRRRAEWSAGWPSRP
jgi:GT2 family glycosyltransferase